MVMAACRTRNLTAVQPAILPVALAHPPLLALPAPPAVVWAVVVAAVFAVETGGAVADGVGA